MNVNILDIILLICLIPTIISGLRKGFISQVVAIVSIVLGVWLSFRFSTVVSEWLGKWTGAGHQQLLDILAFGVILILVIFGLHLIGKLLEASVKIIMLGWLNRLLGVIFSLLKFVLITGILIIIFNTVNEQFHIVSEESLGKSYLYPYLKQAAYTLFPYLKELIAK